MRIEKTIDTLLLAKLNHDVQEMHHDIEPTIFKPYSQEGMREFFEVLLEEEAVSAFIAYFDNKVAGYMIMSRGDRKENFFKESYSIMSIDQICVESYAKGKGIGKALVDYAKHYTKSQNISRLEMNYWTKNVNSGEFFRSQGFENYNERLVINL